MKTTNPPIWQWRPPQPDTFIVGWLLWRSLYPLNTKGPTQ
jgi:hypothetical protein